MARGKAAGAVAEAAAPPPPPPPPAVLSPQQTTYRGIIDAAATQLVPGGEVPPPKRRASRLPGALHFPLVVVLSLAFSSLASSLVNQWTGGELASIERTSGTLGEVAVLLGWRISELALAWFANFDSYDLAALSLLSHGPSLYLVASFYGVRATTAVAHLAVDVLSSFLPFLLLRPLSSAHSAVATVPNREIVTDRPIQAYTTLLAGVIYSVTLSAAYKTFLPTVLVLYFVGIPSVEPAHSVTTYLFVSVPAAVLSLLFGLAARTFIFTPFETTGRTPEDARIDAFDPVSATLKETVWWNLWGYTTRTKVAIARTATVMLVTAIQTYLHCVTTIDGVESYGAIAYSSIWVAAAFLTGLGLGVVGSD